MNQIMRVGKQIFVVALVTGVAAFLGALVVNLAKSTSFERKSIYQLVEEPRLCNSGCSNFFGGVWRKNYLLT